jgi:hypothetical protein
MKGTHFMGTSFAKLRLYIHAVAFIINTIFPPFCETLYVSRLKLCWSFGSLHARCVSVRLRPQNGVLGVHSSWGQKDGSRRLIILAEGRTRTWFIFLFDRTLRSRCFNSLMSVDIVVNRLWHLSSDTLAYVPLKTKLKTILQWFRTSHISFVSSQTLVHSTLKYYLKYLSFMSPVTHAYFLTDACITSQLFLFFP